MKTVYRRNGLPHYQYVGATFAVTTVLHDAVPKISLKRLQQERDQIVKSVIKVDHSGEDWFQDMMRHDYGLKLDKQEALIDKQEHLLSNPIAAQIVADKIMQYDGIWYTCIAYVIMSNHIHFLLDFSIQVPDNYDGKSDLPGYVNLHTAIGRIKGGSAFEINKALGRKGPVWKEAYYDSTIKNDRHLKNYFWYFVNNAVKAKLVESWRDHPFTFAREEYVEAFS